jgi:hypothetical protein
LNIGRACEVGFDQADECHDDEIDAADGDDVNELRTERGQLNPVTV